MGNKSVALQILDNLRNSYNQAYIYNEVNSDSFKHLSLKFYNETQKCLEQLGFYYLADIENEYLTKQSMNPRTFIRVMVHQDHLTNVGFYHIKPNILWRCFMLLIGFRKTKVIEFQSELENGSQIVTSNGDKDSILPTSPDLIRNFESAKYSSDDLYQKHQTCLSNTQKRIGSKPLKFKTINDILESEKRQMLLQKEYLQGIGWVTKEYLLKNGAGSEKRAREIYEEIQEILRKERHFSNDPKKLDVSVQNDYNEDLSWFDDSKIPGHLRDLIPDIKKWGIGDDVKRQQLVSQISDIERKELIRKVKPRFDEINKLLDQYLDKPMPDEIGRLMFMAEAVSEMIV